MVLIKEFHKDVQTAGGSTMRIFFFHPNIPNYPRAKFPGVVVFSEIYQGSSPPSTFFLFFCFFFFLFLSCFFSFDPKSIILMTRGCVVTGPVARFARQIAGQGYICAAPSSFHEFEGPEPLAYDGPGTDRGNELKVTKKLEGYDEDARLTVDALLNLPTCTGACVRVLACFWLFFCC
jgi:carboxymethylenebutenolidase